MKGYDRYHSFIDENETSGKNSSIFTKCGDLIDDETLYLAGICKLNGTCMERNEKEAFQIFLQLAQRGNCDGMYKLAEMYLKQDSPDYKEACFWLNVAARKGHEPSKIKLRYLAEKVPQYSTGALIGSDFKLNELAANAFKNIVLIKSYLKRGGSSNGSGFIIEGNYVITNAHVVAEDSIRIRATFESFVDDRPYELKVVTCRPELDIAVLEFTGSMAEEIKQRQHFRLNLKESFYGNRVYTIGNPKDMGFSLSEGTVSCPRRIYTEYLDEITDYIQVDFKANVGNSGGALLDENNCVLGMVSLSVEGNGSLTMCIPAKYIVQVLNEL